MAAANIPRARRRPKFNVYVKFTKDGLNDPTGAVGGGRCPKTQKDLIASFQAKLSGSAMTVTEFFKFLVLEKQAVAARQKVDIPNGVYLGIRCKAGKVNYVHLDNSGYVTHIHIKTPGILKGRIDTKEVKSLLQKMGRLKELTFDGLGLIGTIPNESLFACVALEVLDLANNNFEGAIPDTALKKGTRKVNLSFNKRLTGRLPSILPRSLVELRLKGLPGLDEQKFDMNDLPHMPDKLALLDVRGSPIGVLGVDNYKRRKSGSLVVLPAPRAGRVPVAPQIGVNAGSVGAFLNSLFFNYDVQNMGGTGNIDVMAGKTYFVGSTKVSFDADLRVTSITMKDNRFFTGCIEERHLDGMAKLEVLDLHCKAGCLGVDLDPACLRMVRGSLRKLNISGNHSKGWMPRLHGPVTFDEEDRARCSWRLAKIEEVDFSKNPSLTGVLDLKVLSICCPMLRKINIEKTNISVIPFASSGITVKRTVTDELRELR